MGRPLTAPKTNIKIKGEKEMKITFTGTFNIDDMRMINEFIETQETTIAEFIDFRNGLIRKVLVV